MKKLFYILILSITVTSCGQFFTKGQLSLSYIDDLIERGEFSVAKQNLKYKIATEKLDGQDLLEINDRFFKMAKMEYAFSKSDSAIMMEVNNYYPGISPLEIQRWKDDNLLEHTSIDGEIKYFNSAAGNMVSVSRDARDTYFLNFGRRVSPVDSMIYFNASKVVNDSRRSKKVMVNPTNFKVRYTIKVKANSVPNGEMIRVWLPFISNDNPSYQNIKIVATSQDDYIISPTGSANTTLYMEKPAVKDNITEFWYEASYTNSNIYHRFDPQSIAPYKRWSSIYRNNTTLASSDVNYSATLKFLADSLVSGESNPYLQSKIIYNWICDNIPFANSYDYSLIPNIPEYVLERKSGNAALVSILYVSLLKHLGIPARVISGWTTYPDRPRRHSWAEVYYEEIGWVPSDISFGRILTPEDMKTHFPRGEKIVDAPESKSNQDVFYFFTRGIDAYRFQTSTGLCGDLYPLKIFPRSNQVILRGGEAEWRGGNLYYDKWNAYMSIL